MCNFTLNWYYAAIVSVILIQPILSIAKDQDCKESSEILHFLPFNQDSE